MWIIRRVFHKTSLDFIDKFTPAVEKHVDIVEKAVLYTVEKRDIPTVDICKTLLNFGRTEKPWVRRKGRLLAL
jgi:hypothetical protein